VRGYPHVQFRHLIAPTEPLNVNFFDDGPEKVNEMIKIGYKDAKKSL